MQLLASAKEEWAQQNNVPDGSHCDINAVLKNVKGGKMPCCPTTGKPMHDIGKVGEDPFCLVHGTMVKTPSPDGTSPGND